ncbi:MAG: HIRAN domain-containing protein [Candidatus Humimicrobiaceae bacterium]
MKEGNHLIFRREPQNPYNNQAIMIMHLENNKLGYIPRKDNKIIANLMDAGKTIYGIISKKKSAGDYGNYEVLITG